MKKPVKDKYVQAIKISITSKKVGLHCVPLHVHSITVWYFCKDYMIDQKMCPSEFRQYPCCGSLSVLFWLLLLIRMLENNEIMKR